MHSLTTTARAGAVAVLLGPASAAAPENLGPVRNTPGEDIEPWVSSDGRLMIFASNGRPDTRGSDDLYVSRHCGGAWSAPRNLDDGVNSPRWDCAARPTPDGRWLLFTSNRALEVPRRRLDCRQLVDPPARARQRPARHLPRRLG